MIFPYNSLYTQTVPFSLGSLWCLGLLLAAASKVLDGKFVALFGTNHGAVRTCAVACWCNGGVVCGRRLFCQDTYNEYFVMLKDIRTDLLEKHG